MTDHGEFQEQVRRLSDCSPILSRRRPVPERDAAKEIIQLLMEVHGKGLERIMEIVFESSESGGALIDRLAKDETAGALLLLYSLHPDAIGDPCADRCWNGCGRDCANCPAPSIW